MKIKAVRNWILVADLLWAFVALGLAIGLRYAGARGAGGLGPQFQAYFFMIVAALAVWAFLYFEMSLDGFDGGWHFPAILSKIVVAVLLLLIFVLAVAFLTRHYYSRLVLLYFSLFLTLGLLGVRCIARLLASSQLRNSADHRCIVLGNGPIARELAAKIASHPEVPFQVVGFLFPEEADASNGFAASVKAPFASIKTLQIVELLEKQNVRKLIIAMRQPKGAEIRKLIDECRKSSINVYLVPQWYDLYVSKAELAEIDGLPLLSLQEREPATVAFVLKRAIDLVLSAGILLFLSPILATAAFVVYSKTGRAFRTEARCGKGGIPFRMLRLNVDRHISDPQRYERLFIRWSLTELPQLWNVFCGEMSLVGPRPESPERVKYYSDWQRQRLKVHAGVTGLAQVHGLRDQHSSEEKARFDLQYIFRWSPLLDLSLILQTVWTVLTRGLRQEQGVSEGARFRIQASEIGGTEPINVDRS
jgi:lipopolysaccharide/colanic/teichoic acid biosynthesis glycosyltransferase